MDVTTHPFLNVIWTFFLIFIWVAWFWLLISIMIDVFRRNDIGGGAKALWIIFVIFLPLLGALVYIVSQGKGMADRRNQEIVDQKTQFDAYVREQAAQAGPAGEIEKAHALLSSGAITQAEFDQLKAKAMAS
jgi:hypothetical protein